MPALVNFFNLPTRSSFKVMITLIMLINLVLTPFQSNVALAAGNNCLTNTSSSGLYTVKVCIDNLTDGAILSGTQTVSATPTRTGADPGVSKLIFYLNGEYLITDYQSPYTFTLPTTKWVDGSYTLAVTALMKDGYTSQPASSIDVTFNNGITTPPTGTNSFAPTSGTTPASGQPLTVAVTGDGVDGATNASLVTDLIASWNPNLFLYVGDVYEKGSKAEFYNWYGTGNNLWGRFRSITDPVIGNHEYENGVAPGYRDYWDLGQNTPTYYSYDAAGWHFIALNSNCGLLQDCAVGQTQYQWLLNDLNTHNNVCTIAYFHHPVFNVGPEGYAASMNAMWTLMAQHGVDIVLTGHDHDYQRWMPLDGNVNNQSQNGFGNPSPTGITEFVTGGGGHGIQQFTVNPLDNRMVVGFDTSPSTFGALRLQLNQYGASFQYINHQGTTLDSGAVPCNGAPTDTTAPTVPTNLTATTSSSTRADLSWGSSNDNVGIAGYNLYRNGTLLTSLGVVNSYSDTNLTLGTTYSYQVKARDAAGNLSNFSSTAVVTTPILLFSDGFETGNFSAWTSNTNNPPSFAVQQQEVYSGTYAARQTKTGAGTTQTFASKTLNSTLSDLYYSLRFKVISKGANSAYLQRFRTSANGAVLGIFVSSTNRLSYRNDTTKTNNETPGPIVSFGDWHAVQTHVHINGASSQIEVWYDGALVPALSVTTNLGSLDIGRLQLGDNSATDGASYDVALDEVGVNTSFIDTTDAVSPSQPTGVSASATAPNSVNLTWNAASDNVNVTGYNLFRNNGLLATVGAVTTYTDTPVSPGFTYNYQVQARDAAGNVSALSAVGTVTTPADTTPPTVTLTGPADGITVNANVVISADAMDNVGVEDVDFLVDGNIVGTVGEGGPYQVTWDSTTVPDGPFTITARAVDTSGNTTTSSSRTIEVFNAAGDTTPPSEPTSFTVTAGGASRADLAWNASTDNVGVVAYDIYRDDALLTSVGAVTSYGDANVQQGATYQYKIRARDAVGNISGFTANVSVTIPAPLFQEGFESGNLTSWTNNGLTIQQQGALEGQYDVEAKSTAGTANYATRTFPAKNDVYYTTWFKIISHDANSVFLQRFRTSGNVAILGTFVSGTGKLGYRNDITPGTVTSTTSVSSGVWHQLQTHVHVNGGSGQVEIWLDGVQVSGLSNTESLGAAPVGMIQLGENSTGKNFDVVFDELTFDTSLIRSAAAPFTVIDSGPVGTVSSNAANFSFSSTTANATFECSLDNAVFSACTSPQNLTGLVDGAHTFAVRSRDPLSSVVDPTPASSTWTVDTTAPTIINKTPADSAIDISLTANVDATFSESMNPASLTTSSFTLMQQSDGTPITATVTYDSVGKKATLDPASALSYGTIYVVTVKGGAGGATDASGNALTSDVSWSFTTTPPDTTLPNVTILAPANGANVGGTVILSADASDNIAVDHVDFLVDGNVVGTAASAPYTIDWNSTTLPNGAATVTAHAVDTSANSADASINVMIVNDVTPPGAPTNLVATTASSAKIDLTWTASTDNVGVTGYDIKRNGTLLASVGAVTSYSDATATPSTTYQYQVFAKDAAGNISSASNTASATTLAALFSDNFETGDMTLWTLNSGLSVQQQEVLAGLHAARATSNGSTVANAYAQLAVPQYDLYYDTSFKILSQDPLNSVYLLRLRTADTQSLLGVFVSATGKLGYRNDLSSSGLTNGPSVSLNTWHEVQIHVHVDSVNANAGLVEMWFDGAPVASQVEALGTAPVARLQIGENATNRTYDIAFDNVVAANSYINPGDLTAPSVPSNLNANAISDSLVNLSWSAASDNVGVTSYVVYRNGTQLAITGATTSYSDTTTLPLTNYQYEVQARDAAGNLSGLSTPASVTTPADTTPPTISVTAPSNGTLLSGLVTLAANATDAVAVDHVDFLVNNNVVGTDNTAPYSITWNSATIADGSITITARAVDTSNNAAVSAGVIATLDNTPPDTSITSGPSALTNATSASFSFTATEANSTFACSLDGSTFNSCVSPATYSALTSGSHTFQVRSTDGAGNTDGTPASQTWTVDAIAPTVTSTVPTSGATAVSPAANITAVFSEAMNAATITASTFTVKVKQGNNPPLAAVVSYDPATRTAMLDPNANLSNSTTYTVTVKGGISGVKDSVGNALASDFGWNFTTGTLDLTPPTVTLTAPTNGATISGPVTLSANASDNVAVNHVDFLVNNSVVGTDATSPYSISWNSASVADGSATIVARAVDNASNTTLSTGATVTVNNTSVDTTITAGPSGSVNTTSASFSFTATVTGSTFACSLDGAAFSTCTSPNAYSALTNGSHTFQVRATNPSGFTDPSPASRTWTIDTVVPDTTISSGPTGTVGIASASFSFTSTEAGSSFTCSLDGAAFSSCSSPQNYTNLANGSHTFQVRAGDAAGNIDSTPASRTWTVDTLPPDTTITAGQSGSVNTASASFSFTATEAGSTFACSLDGAAFSSCTSPKAYSGLTNGSHTFQVRATDAIGNTDSTPASRTWTVDTIAPTGVAITAPANGASVTGQVTISATASDNVGVTSVSFYVDGQLLATDSSSPFSTNWNTNPVSKTSHTLYVRATDAAGNTTQSTTITVTVR
jgi:chitodextrinase